MLLVVGFAEAPSLAAQRSTNRPNAQDINARQNDSTTAQIELELPDSIIVFSYDPRAPKQQRPVLDSALDLAYVRYDPVQRYGPDYVYLNSLAQPAAANPILGAAFTPYRQLLQARHPAYQPLAAPFLGLNLPYAYTAYNQGGEVDDGQINVLFGSPFANGYQLGLVYRRSYPSGRNNRYPSASGDRIQLALALAFAPDSSHHRGYASLQSTSWGFNNPGGYTFALVDTLGVPETPFVAEPILQTLRTEGRLRNFNYLHRYFLRQQNTGADAGWAVAADLSYHRERQRSSTTELDSASFEPLLVDDRGLRSFMEERTVLAKAYLEYFSPPATGAGLDFDLRAGVYGGSQRFSADFLSGALPQNLFGLHGTFSTVVSRQFDLRLEATVPLDNRASLGQLRGKLGWRYRDLFGLEANALLERTDAPFAAEYFGVNDVLLQQRQLPTSTHTRLGGALTYLPWAARLEAYVESYTGGWVFERYGVPRPVSTIPTIPTLAYQSHLEWRWLHVDLRGVLRASRGTADVYLPAFTGQQAVYAEVLLFRRAMQLMGGVDTWVRSPTRLYGYAPLTSVFYVDAAAAELGWQYSTDLFLAFKVQSFKFFVRLENAFISINDGAPPRTVTGFPLIRSGGGGFSAGLFRLGVSFSLYN